MLVPRKSPVRLGMADQFKLMKWMDEHKAVLHQSTRSQLARQIKAEIGVYASQTMLSSIEESMGIQRSRGGTSESRKDRVIVVAMELVRLMKQLDVVPSDDLVDVVNAK